MNKRRWIRLALISLLSIIVVAVIAFVGWAYSGGNAMPEALAAIESTDQVQVVQDDLLSFIPRDEEATSGFIFYPGGRVDPEAYAPMAQSIAAAGHVVVVVPVPLRLAFFGIDRGEKALQRFSEVDEWAVGGHSLGGVAASIFVARNPGIDKLVLLASYPSESLSDRENLRAVSIYGTVDGLIAPEEVEDSRSSLPPQTELIPIEGGNHAQFGWYGLQNGDGTATITRQEQMDQVVEPILALLQ